MKKIFSAFVFFALCSCQPTVLTHGNISIIENMEKFVIGKTKIEDVYQMCGTPSLKKDEFTLIYCSWKTEDISFKKLKVKDKTVVRLRFSHNGVLQKIEKIEAPQKDKDSQLVSNDEGIKLITESEAEKIVEASH